MSLLPTKNDVALSKVFSFFKSELANLIAERDELQSVVIPNIEAEYQLKIGYLEYEKFKAQVSVNRLKRGIELAQAAINRGEPVNITEIEETLYKEFSEWEEKLREHFHKIEAAKHHVNALLSQEESQGIARIYKKIVKSLHPDVNPEAYKKNRDLWERAMEAYQNGDLEGLRILLLLLEEESDIPVSDADYLESRIEQIKTSIKSLVAEIKAIKSKPPFTLKEKLQDAGWLKNERERLKGEIEALEMYQSRLQNTFNKLCFPS